MNEHEVLELLQAYEASQREMIAQVISLHLVIVAAVFYFLHRSGLIMKLAVFVLYALGNAMYVTQMYNVSMQIVGARANLASLRDAGPTSPITEAVLVNTGASWVNAAAIATNLSFLALWLGTTFFLFFWKRPGETS